MRRSGVITQRRYRRERGRRMRRYALSVGAILLISSLAMSDGLRAKLSRMMEDGAATVQAFASGQMESTEVLLEETQVYALQLGVFDNGERAMDEQKRLGNGGTLSTIWQGERLRIICDAAKTQDALDMSVAGRNDVYVFRDTLPQVRLRISCAQGDGEAVKKLIELPDRLFHELKANQERTLQQITTDTKQLAQQAMEMYPDHLLYNQLAQSLINWCRVLETRSEDQYARNYGAAAMCMICREWRTALLNHYEEIEERTASAQRTPSTAADVMPPA